MKNKDKQNCIIYVGNAHVPNIANLLSKIGFKITHNKLADLSKTRICIDDIIPFDQFFTTAK